MNKPYTQDFINKYNQFENTTNNEIFNEGYDSVRQYKLASSEGVNKMKKVISALLILTYIFSIRPKLLGQSLG